MGASVGEACAAVGVALLAAFAAVGVPVPVALPHAARKRTAPGNKTADLIRAPFLHAGRTMVVGRSGCIDETRDGEPRYGCLRPSGCRPERFNDATQSTFCSAEELV